MLDSAVKSINQVNGKLQSLEHMPQEIGESAKEALEKVGDRLENLGGMSPAQSEKMDKILALLQQMISVQAQNIMESGTAQGQSEIPEVVDHYSDTDQPQASDDGGLQDALDRLCQIAKDKEGTVFSTEAATIIEDIEHVLTLLVDAEGFASPKINRKGKRKREPTNVENEASEQDQQTIREVKRVKGLLTTSHCLELSSNSALRSCPELTS